MAHKYLVTANCDNERCQTTTFEALRKKMTYMATDDREYLISRLTCPDCRMLGHVDKIEQVAR